jgi:hypothetical protein
LQVLQVRQVLQVLQVLKVLAMMQVLNDWKCLPAIQACMTAKPAKLSNSSLLNPAI